MIIKISQKKDQKVLLIYLQPVKSLQISLKIYAGFYFHLKLRSLKTFSFKVSFKPYVDGVIVGYLNCIVSAICQSNQTKINIGVSHLVQRHNLFTYFTTQKKIST